jgi:hypothetical protein
MPSDTHQKMQLPVQNVRPCISIDLRTLRMKNAAAFPVKK